MIQCHHDPATPSPRDRCFCEACYRTRTDHLPPGLRIAYDAAFRPDPGQPWQAPTTADALLVRVIDRHLRGDLTLEDTQLELVRQLRDRANLFERELLAYLALQSLLPSTRFRQVEPFRYEIDRNAGPEEPRRWNIPDGKEDRST